jgi:hypothetical protein
VAVADTATVAAGTPTLINVRANDTDPEGGAITLVSATTATGTAVVQSGQVLYTPPAGFSGPATISYVIADPAGATATGTVSVTVTPPANQPPVAVADSATVAAGTPTLINVRANDTDPEGGAITLVSATTATGTAVVQSGQVLYTPPAGFSGPATISYVIADPAGATATGTVSVTVTPPANQPPVAVADSATVFSGTPTLINVRANDTDPEGGAITLVSATTATGTAVVQSGQVLYTSPVGFSGPATISYVIADPAGATATGTVSVTVTVPVVSATANAQGTLTVQAETGTVTITVTSPPDLAGTYTGNTGLLAGGPVNLVLPRITGTTSVGSVLTAASGLWLHTGTSPTVSRQWRRDGTSIAGATGETYVIAAADAGRAVSVVETLTDAAGSRTATSLPAAVPSAFVPGDDAGVIVWYDADTPTTLTASGGVVSSWLSRAGTQTLGQVDVGSRPATGTRSIGGRNALDFNGTDRMSGPVAVPADGNVAVHAVLAIDSVTSAFAAILSMDGAAADFQVDANSATQFDGRMNVSGIGASVALTGGPFSGARILSVVFDRTGSGTFRVFVDGVERGTSAYTASLDATQVLYLMSNRSQNAYVDGAVGEVIVTRTVTNRALYHAYLSARWGIA